MLKRLDTTKLNIVVAFILICTTFIGYFYVNISFVASAMWPTAGFIVAIFYLHDKRALPGLIIGTLFANLIARLIFMDETIILKIVYSIAFTMSNLFQAKLFKILIPKITKDSLQVMKSGLIFIGVAIIVSIIGTVISVSILYITNGCTNFIGTAVKWAFG
ncbi:MAG: hypothetical protein KAH16_05565, partial [Candidatus Izimaplasma sp.]|nr:hypothetical protein [Candidatus Izimaplasma bacterium]